MKKFLREILKRSDDVAQGPISNTEFSIGSPKVFSNNGCETVYVFSIIIPTGNTGSVDASIVSGYEGSGIPAPGTTTILGSQNLAEGEHKFSISLGNSGQNNVSSAYRVEVELSSGPSKTEVFSRTAANSAFYDSQPC